MNGTDTHPVRFHMEEEEEEMQDGEIPLKSNDESHPSTSLNNSHPPFHATTTNSGLHPRLLKKHSSSNANNSAARRGRSYSSAEEHADLLDDSNRRRSMVFDTSYCFDADFIEQPLLQDRGTASETAQHLFGTPPPRLSMEWKNLTLRVSAPTPHDKKAKKTILFNCSGRAYSGEMLAVMGPSGSGML
jgi:ABC-type multidrug transport system fused ATPase/permease subunit